MDGNGIEGIELAAEKRLAGKPGSRRVMKDRLGRIVEDAWLKEPMNGENITLTIDSRLQNLAYEALGRQVENLKAKGGSIVIADPKTGDILALANYPSFDPNNRGKVSRTGVRNRAIVDTYEPGSTMKCRSRLPLVSKKRKSRRIRSSRSDAPCLSAVIRSGTLTTVKS